LDNDLLGEPGPPPPALREAVRLVACGGLGEIGRNMLAIQHDDQAIVIDCGVLFPSPDEPGVDLILPDLSILSQAGIEPTHIVLTHGHEDHIGGVPYLLERYPHATLVGSRLTLALVQAKMTERGIKADSIVVDGDSDITVGHFRLRFFSVHHSVPDGLAVAINVNGATIFHTGDFKLDPVPLDNRVTDLAGFARIGDEGVDILLSDSTCADVPLQGANERELMPIFRSLIEQATGRVIFACFASNVHRVQQAVDAATQAKRRFAFVGRSMIRNMSIAAELGYLRLPSESWVELRDAIDSAPSDVVLICTGSQGEPLSALARIGRREHQIKPHAGDLVVLSARLIPGNETDIFRVVNDLSRHGVEVLHTDNSQIHASGHATAPELAQILRMVRPRYLIPIHGEWRHMRAHARIAYGTGMSPDQVLLLSNGEVLDFVRKAPLVTGQYDRTELYVEGSTVGQVSARTLRDRRRLGESGVVIVALAVDSTTGAVVGTPKISTAGVPDIAPEADLMDIVVTTVERWSGGDSRTLNNLERELRSGIGKWFRQHKLQPVVEVTAVAVTLPLATP